MFLPNIGKIDKLQGKRCQEIDDSVIREEFLLEYIKLRLKNSSRISIIILVGNAADCGIPMEFWLEFQLILNGAKSADCD